MYCNIYQIIVRGQLYENYSPANCLCFRPIVFVVKNASVFESNFVFATLMPLTNNQSNTSQQSDENAQCTSRVMKGTSFKNRDIACTPSKRKLSPIHAGKSCIDSPMAGTLFLNFPRYF
jgi:subtilase family serine protease